MKWYQETEQYQKWAKENDSQIGTLEKQSLTKTKKDIEDVLTRIAEIAHQKNLNLPTVKLNNQMISEHSEINAKLVIKDIIPKDDFLSLMMSIAYELKTIVTKVKKGLSSNAKFIYQDNLRQITSAFFNTSEVCISMKNDFSAVLTKYESIDDPKQMLSELELVLDNYLDEKFLKKKYPGHRNESEKEIRLGIIKPEQLEKIIDSAINDDGYFSEKEIEENKRKIEAEIEENKRKIEENKRKIEAEIDSFKSDFYDWKISTNAIIANISSKDFGNEADNSVPKNKIIREIMKTCSEWKKFQPNLGLELEEKILSELKEDSLKVRDVVAALSNSTFNITTNEIDIFLNWKKSRYFPDYSPIKTSITNCVQKTNENTLIEQYMNWFKLVGGAWDNLQKNKNLSEIQLFKIPDLLSDLKKILNNEHCNFMYPLLEANMKACGKNLASLENLNQAWKNTLYKVIISSNMLEIHFDKLRDETKANEDANKLLSIVNNISKILESTASSDSLIQCFWNNRYIPAPAPVLAKGEHFDFDIVLNDGTILRNTVFTTIVDAKPYYAEANKVSVTPVSGKRGFSFQEVKDFTITETLKSADTISCFFEYKIPFNKDKGSTSNGTERTEVLSIETIFGSYETDIDMTEVNIENSTEISGKIVANTTIISGGKQLRTEKGKSTEIAFGKSLERSKSKSINTELGEDSGFFHIKMVLISSGQDEKTINVKLTTDTNWISSPDSKGFSTKQPDDVKKVMLWKK